MPNHKVGTQEEWSAARKELLEREQERGNLDEELARKRQELPWVPVEKEYTFDTEEGKKTLPELFEGRSQLLIYHLMFGPTYQNPMRKGQGPASVSRASYARGDYAFRHEAEQGRRGPGAAPGTPY